MAKVAGTAFFTVDGVRFSLKGNMTVALTGIERESVVGLDERHGTKENIVSPFIECDITDKADVDIDLLNKLENKTVTVELNNGKTGVLQNADQMNHIELGVDEGEMTVRFEGPRGHWVKP